MIPGGYPAGGKGLPPSEALDPEHASRRQRYLENREKDLTLSWKGWLRERYARYWYLLGCFLLDLVVGGTVLQVFTASPAEGWQYALAIVLVVVLLYPEYVGYTRLWPPHSLE